MISHLCGELQGHAVLLHGLRFGVGMGLAMMYGLWWCFWLISDDFMIYIKTKPNDLDDIMMYVCI